MRSLKATTIIASVLLGTLSATYALEIGDSIVDRDVEMRNIDESMVTIKAVKGSKGTLVMFSCNHCPVVKAWQEVMVETAHAALDKEIGVIFINSNNPETKGDTFEGMQELAAAQSYRFPYVVDATSDVARHFGATKTPDVFLFDANDRLVYQGAVGEGGRTPLKDGARWLQQALDSLAAGQPIENPKTAAVGCSIKFR